VELWWFRHNHDTRVLGNRVVWWAPLFLLIPHSLSWGTAVIGTCLALDWERWKREGARLVDAAPAGARFVAFTALHALSFLGLDATTGFLLERGLEGSVWAWIGPLPWLALAAAAAATLLLALAQPAQLRAAYTSLRGNLARGLAIGTSLALTAGYVTTHWPYWEVLNRGTLEIAHRLLRPFLDEQIYLPEDYIIGPPEFPVVLTRYCSGYQGLSLFVVFFTAFLVLERRRLRFPQSLLLLPLGALAAWLLNGLRVALLVLVGHWYDKEVAVEGFHKSAGWTFSLVVALGAVALATRSSLFSRSRPKPRTASTVNPTALYLGPLLALVATKILVGAFLVSPEPLVPLEALVCVATLLAFRREYGPLVCKPSAHALALGLLTAALWVGLHRTASEEHPLAWQASHAPWFLAVWWFAQASLSALIVPVAEELAFRGFLLRRLLQPDFESVDPKAASWFAIAISSIAFGLLHPDWLAGSLAGLAFGLAYQRRGRLGDAVAAHVVANTIVALWAWLSGEWWVWL